MAEQPRRTSSRIEIALRLALEEAAETRRRRELERNEQRRTLRVVDGGGRQAA